MRHGRKSRGDGKRQLAVPGFGLAHGRVRAFGDLFTRQILALRFKLIFDLVSFVGLLGGDGGIYFGELIRKRVVQKFRREIDAVRELIRRERLAVVTPGDFIIRRRGRF